VELTHAVDHPALTLTFGRVVFEWSEMAFGTVFAAVEGVTCIERLYWRLRASLLALLRFAFVSSLLRFLKLLFFVTASADAWFD
jgi:hypothetical protein